MSASCKPVVGARFSRNCTLLLVVLVLLAACSTPPVAPPPQVPLAGPATGSPRTTAPVAGPGRESNATGAPSPNAQNDQGKNTPAVKKNVAVVRVYYATDRTRSSQSDPAKMYGNKRGVISYGSCEVALPREERIGKGEALAVSRLEFKDPPDTHPTLRKVFPREHEAFLETLKATIAKSPKKSVFVFVHGYNVSFADAARRTAQMKYDLGFEGAPIFFSWPSKGRVDAYAADEADVEWAQPDLKEFLKDIAGKTKAKNIYLIAHSMGNRALAKAYIYLMSERPELKSLFREVILVTPDIDSDLFKRDLAPALAAASNRTTLYSSSKDPTLKTSNKFQNYPRAGDSGANLLLFEGIETIDATNANTTLTRLPHINDNPSVITDIYHLIREGKSPGERFGLKTVDSSSGQYWRFKIQ